MRKLRVLLLTCTPLLLTGVNYAQEPLTYSLLEPAGAQPSGRFDGTVAYDSAGGRIFMFGGQDTAAKNDLWAYSLSERRWEEVQVSGPRPAARFGHTLIYDPVRRRLVVFGGQASGFFSDVWAFDTARGSWQQLSADNAGPSRRYAHSAIYDMARDRMVISHGFTSAGRFDDTWAFDFASSSWRDLSPSGTRPLRRCLHHAVLDNANNQMLLYGGCASGFGPCPLGDLWSFDLSANRWTERTGQLKPPPREHYGMGFDAVRGRLLIFGGSGSELLSDTWEYDPLSNAWQQPVLSGNGPSGRSRHEATAADEQGTIFFFGGLTRSGPTNELWMLGRGAVSRKPEIASGGVIDGFSGTRDAVAPGQIVSILGAGLGPATGVAFTFDPQSGQLPTSGEGVAVTWNGIPAPLYFARFDQLNIQVPYELSGASEARLIVTVNGQESDPVTKRVAATQPGLSRQIWNQDGSLNSAENPASPGSIVVLYATGVGLTRPLSRTGAAAVGVYPEPQESTVLLVGGLEAELLFRGQAPGTTGVTQINARVPQTFASAAGVPVVLAVGAGQSQAGVLLFVR